MPGRVSCPCPCAPEAGSPRFLAQMRTSCLTDPPGHNRLIATSQNVHLCKKKKKKKSI